MKGDANSLTEQLVKAFKDKISVEMLTDLIIGIMDKAVTIIGILILAYFVLKFGNKTIDKLFKLSKGEKTYIEVNRANTLTTLLKSILRYIVYFMALVTMLEVFGADTKGILTGAGIVGLAVGFGAQNLVRDVITGFFIVFEDHFTVGEYITTSDISGFVEEFGLRITKIRDFSGEYHIIPNGEISKVTNHSRGGMRALVDVGVAYEENTEEVSRVLNSLCEQVAQEFKEVIIEGPTLLGIQDFGASEVVYRITASTKPMEQWRVERELRKRIKDTFDNVGIEIPYSKTVYIPGEPQVSRENI